MLHFISVNINLNSLIWLGATILDSASLYNLGQKLPKIWIQLESYIYMDYFYLSQESIVHMETNTSICFYD